jgi:hypothetical protein
MKNIFIGPSVRSGGSLINRLFDGHPDVAAYPFELFLPMDKSIHHSLEFRGQKVNIQNFPKISKIDTQEDIFDKILLNTDQDKCLIGKHFKNGKLSAKTSGLDIHGSFQYKNFLSDLSESIGENRKIDEVYNSLHEAFFRNWDDGAHSGTMDYVAYHSGNGLMADIELYLSEFKDSYFIQPIRDVRGYLASEKKKVFRQVIGRGRLGSKINWPDWMLKHYFGRYFESMLVNWMITVTRSVILKKRLGDRYIIYRHEDLIRNPRIVMEKITQKIGMKFNDSLINPTVAGVDWRGNSMFGLQSGINPQLADIRDVFNPLEQKLIDKYCGGVLNHLTEFENELIEFDDFNQDFLFDYDLQEKYYKDREKTALYFASMYERWKYNSVGSDIMTAIRQRPKSYFLK